MNRELYVIKLNGYGKKKLSQKDGDNIVQFGKQFKYYINTYSNANTPQYFTVNSYKGKLLRVLEENNSLKETIDQIEAAKYLNSLKYVDSQKIGIWGWSYGGYMSTACLTKGADYFRLGLAVAPVTNWRYYDNIYTERFMRTPQEIVKDMMITHR